MKLTRTRFTQMLNFGVRASASVFNVVTVWSVFYFFGSEWGGSLYLHLSSIFIVSTLARMGVDQSLLLSAQQIAIPAPFFSLSFLLSIGLFFLAQHAGLTPPIGLLEVSVLLFLAQAIAYAEAIVRTLPESAPSHASVIGVQSLCVLCVAPFPWPVDMALCVALFLQLGFYLILIRAKKGTMSLTFKSGFDVSLCGLVHGSHGLINQNFLNYFVTRFGTPAELPYIVTLVRILYLSSWPLSQFTFSGIHEKSKNGKAFKESGLFYGACALSGLCFMIMLVYSYNAGVPRLMPIGILLSIGIISFSLGADKMYRPAGHPAYNFLFPFQMLVVVASVSAGQLSFLNNLIIVVIFSTYLMTCSLFSRFYR